MRKKPNERYVYSAHAALYMHQEHGLRFHTEAGRPLFPQYLNLQDIPHYVSPESEATIEAFCEGDRVYSESGGVSAYYIVTLATIKTVRKSPDSGKEEEVEIQEPHLHPLGGKAKKMPWREFCAEMDFFKVIERNGKAFLPPRIIPAGEKYEAVSESQRFGG